MTVYVDRARIPYRRMRVSHMVADSSSELLAMAQRLDLKMIWRQKGGTPSEHFDIAETKRREAIKLGAVETDSRGLVRIIRTKRKHQYLKETR